MPSGGYHGPTHPGLPGGMSTSREAPDASRDGDVAPTGEALSRGRSCSQALPWYDVPVGPQDQISCVLSLIDRRRSGKEVTRPPCWKPSCVVVLAAKEAWSWEDGEVGVVGPGVCTGSGARRRWRSGCGARGQITSGSSLWIRPSAGSLDSTLRAVQAEERSDPPTFPARTPDDRVWLPFLGLLAWGAWDCLSPRCALNEAVEGGTRGGTCASWVPPSGGSPSVLLPPAGRSSLRRRVSPPSPAPAQPCEKHFALDRDWP